jgi:aerobic-type carbon monoxide dehydrogenase small subunit (CoxS/CutS family)
VIVNGRAAAAEPWPNELLLDYLRERLGLTGAKRSCEVQVCGACTVLVDGLPVSACCYLAADAAGRSVLTVEGLAEREDFAVYEEAFTRHAAVQCGFCTSGLLLTVDSFLQTGDDLSSADAVRTALGGNLCRCTGYKGVVEAVRDIADRVRARPLLETD